MTVFSRRRSRGIQLLDFSVAAIVIGVAAAAVVGMMSTTSDDRKTAQTLQDISNIQSSIQRSYAQRPNYFGLSNTSLITVGGLPSRLAPDGSTLISELGGTLVVAGNQSEYYIRLNDIPASACSSLATTDFGPSLISFELSDTNGTSIAQQSTPATISQASSACRSPDGVNAIIWYFK